MLVCFCFVFLILFNACKYFKRPLGNQLPKCVEGLPFLNKSHNNNNNSRHFASKCHIRHNSSYSANIAMATYCFNLAAILAVSVMYSSSRVISRDQQAKIADT